MSDPAAGPPAGGQARHRAAITVCVMLATIMQALDTTIANVATPFMKGSLNASLDQINWVLTSYMVAAAIMTPPTAWLARRFGRKEVFVFTVAGFTVASILCGAAQTLEQMVVFRVMQGMFGAPLVPLSQSVLLDIYPRERHGEAMAIWGVGVMVGPIAGPTLGGWLTEAIHWRWVFYINLPIGLLTIAGLLAFLDRPPRDRWLRMDWFGFGTLSLAIGAFQLMLDRGEHLGWFDSTEIVVEATVAGLSFYLFLVHTFTTVRPFVDPIIFRDRNFSISLVLMFATALLLFGSLALLTPFMQLQMGYPVLTAGWILAPRGFGTMLGMLFVGRVIGIVDARLILACGFLLIGTTLADMSLFTDQVPFNRLLVSGFIQGVGFGFVFVPLTVVAFSTIAPEHRPQGTALYSLLRNLGGSIGISIVIFNLSHDTQRMRAAMVEHITPFAPAMRARVMPDAWDLDTAGGLAAFDAVVTSQATLMAYLADFRFLSIVAFLALPLVCLIGSMRR